MNAVIALVAYVLTEAGREFYRPYVYHNGIKDFGIADTLGNTFGVVAILFLILAFSGKKTRRDYVLLLVFTVGVALYELAQGPMGGAIDPKDILATFIAGGVSTLLYRTVHRIPMRLGKEGSF